MSDVIILNTPYFDYSINESNINNIQLVVERITNAIEELKFLYNKLLPDHLYIEKMIRLYINKFVNFNIYNRAGEARSLISKTDKLLLYIKNYENNMNILCLYYSNLYKYFNQLQLNNKNNNDYFEHLQNTWFNKLNCYLNNMSYIKPLYEKILMDYDIQSFMLK